MKRDKQDLEEGIHRISDHPILVKKCETVVQSLKSCPTLQPHGLQHATLPCSSVSPGVWWNSCLLVMPSSHLILCHHLLLLPSIFPSIRVFSKESALRIRWPKCWKQMRDQSTEHPRGVDSLAWVGVEEACPRGEREAKPLCSGRGRARCKDNKVESSRSSVNVSGSLPD